MNIVDSMKRHILRRALTTATAAGLALGAQVLTVPAALSQGGTPGLMEFRWDTDRNYRKLYYFQTSSIQNDRAEWFLTLRAKDRKTAIMKLTVTVPDYFDAKLKPERMSLCRTSAGSMTSR